METKDHKMLAEFLLSRTEVDIPYICQKAFILGNIEPDRNPFTYLHGIIHGEKFHGHNYENTILIMRKLFNSLRNKWYFGIIEYYHLGKLMHYMVDAFTFPHNNTFKKTLKEHCIYERELHKRFSNMLKKQQFIKHEVKTLNDFKDIEILHNKYLQIAGDYEDDCKYIMYTTEILLSIICPNREFNIVFV